MQRSEALSIVREFVKNENLVNHMLAVEATMRSVKHPFRNGKVPVRGNPRVSMVIIASAAMVNLRRIHRYQAAKRKEMEALEQANRIAKNLSASLSSFFSKFRNYLRIRLNFQPIPAFFR